MSEYSVAYHGYYVVANWFCIYEVYSCIGLFYLVKHLILHFFKLFFKKSWIYLLIFTSAIISSYALFGVEQFLISYMTFSWCSKLIIFKGMSYIWIRSLWPENELVRWIRLYLSFTKVNFILQLLNNCYMNFYLRGQSILSSKPN